MIATKTLGAAMYKITYIFGDKKVTFSTPFIWEKNSFIKTLEDFGIEIVNVTYELSLFKEP